MTSAASPARERAGHISPNPSPPYSSSNCGSSSGRRKASFGAALRVVSNGNSRPERHGLGGFFTFVLLSDDHGIEKPDPQVFEMAADAAGCAVSEIVHVGDNPLTDVAGANQAGALSVWLNRSGRTLAPGEPGPLREIGSLRELPRLVESMAGD